MKKKKAAGERPLTRKPVELPEHIWLVFDPDGQPRRDPLFGLYAFLTRKATHEITLVGDRSVKVRLTVVL